MKAKGIAKPAALNKLKTLVKKAGKRWTPSVQAEFDAAWKLKVKSETRTTVEKAKPAKAKPTKEEKVKAPKVIRAPKVRVVEKTEVSPSAPKFKTKVKVQPRAADKKVAAPKVPKGVKVDLQTGTQPKAKMSLPKAKVKPQAMTQVSKRK